MPFATYTTGSLLSFSKCLRKAVESHRFEGGRVYRNGWMAADRHSGGGLANSKQLPPLQLPKGDLSSPPLLMSAFSTAAPSAQLSNALSLIKEAAAARGRPANPTGSTAGSRGGWVRQAAARRRGVMAAAAVAFATKKFVDRYT